MRFVKYDIVNIKADVIVNASNSMGWMGGWIGKYIRLKGVAESIHYLSKGEIEKQAKRVAKWEKPSIGDVFVTSAHPLQAYWLFHAVTIDKPRRRSSLQTIPKCLDNILKKAREYGATSIAIPALGTGTGRLAINDVAKIYSEKLGRVNDIEILIVDPFGSFIEQLRDVDLSSENRVRTA